MWVFRTFDRYGINFSIMRLFFPVSFTLYLVWPFFGNYIVVEWLGRTSNRLFRLFD